MTPPPFLFIDSHLIVADKPAGLLAVPGKGEAGRDNLAARVQAVHADALIVHRLDMATSGLMLLARGAEMQRQLSIAFAQRLVHKRYVAVVEGELAQDSGTIDLPLAADWPNRPRQKVDVQFGKPALTHWRVVARDAGCTRVELTPISGRSHQLRLHLQTIGHPIRGDTLYAPEPMRSDRLLLHATALALRHPASGEPLSFSSSCPF